MAKYIVLEIQKSEDGTVAIPPLTTHDTFWDAQARYHTILAAAATSSVAVHTALILNDVGQEIALTSYNHVDGQIE